MTDAPAKRWTTATCIFTATLLTRLGWIFLAQTYVQDLPFGAEMTKIAVSLAQGTGFASPFRLPVGHVQPTAVVAPLYPFLMAAIFKLLDPRTYAALIAIQTMNAVFDAATAVVLYALAKRQISAGFASAAGWAWCLLPFALQPWTRVTRTDVPFNLWWGTGIPWESALSALLATSLLLLALHLDEHPATSCWAGAGAAWGLAALTNPTLLAMSPFLLGVPLLRQRPRSARLKFAGVAALCFIAVILPWCVRNYLVLGRFSFIRDNAFEELRIGNSKVSEGIYIQQLHAADNDVELRRYREIGEPAFMDEQRTQFFDVLRDDPARLLRLTLKRAVYFWFGPPVVSSHLGMASELKNLPFAATTVLAFIGLWRLFRRNRRFAWLCAGMLAMYPLAYYVTFFLTRFRRPIEPVILMLAIYAVESARSRA